MEATADGVCATKDDTAISWPFQVRVASNVQAYSDHEERKTKKKGRGDGL